MELSLVLSLLACGLAADDTFDIRSQEANYATYAAYATPSRSEAKQEFISLRRFCRYRYGVLRCFRFVSNLQ